MRASALFPYLIIVCGVMTVYSAFLLHLSRSVRTDTAVFPVSPRLRPSTAIGSESNRFNEITGAEVKGPSQPQCSCTAESKQGVQAGSHVAMGLSFPYRYFNSNHWFHISEYYLSRHTHVAPKLPRDATVYIVAPHGLFVANLMPMTFFLLILAFTDGTARTATVLSREALAHEMDGPMRGDVAWAFDTNGMESYVYDSSLPAFNRTRRCVPGERQQQQQQHRQLLPPSSHSRGLMSAHSSLRRPKQEQEQEDEGGAFAIVFRRRKNGEIITPVSNEPPPPPGRANYVSEEQQEDVADLDAVPGGGGSFNKRGSTLSSIWGFDAEKSDEENQIWDWSRQPLAHPFVQARGGGEGEKEPGREAAEGGPIARKQQRLNADSSGKDTGNSGGSSNSNREQNPKLLLPLLPASGGITTTVGSPDANADTAAEAAAVGRILLNEALAVESGAALDVDQGRDRVLSSRAVNSVKSCECAKYIGEFGSAPVERGYWFKDEKVEDARARIDAICGDIYRSLQEGRTPNTGVEAEAGGKLGGWDDTLAGGTRPRRLVIYQRDSDRRLLDLDGNIRVLQELLGPSWRVVDILHDNKHEPCWLYSQLMDADMLLTPHGFQSMLLLFLPPGATILEVFPYKYWKEGYAPLAKEWGVQHEHIMSRPVAWMKGLALFFIPLERCMRSIDCRKWSRGADVRLEEHHLKQIAQAAKTASRRKQEFLPPRSPGARGSGSNSRRHR